MSKKPLTPTNQRHSGDTPEAKEPKLEDDYELNMPEGFYNCEPEEEAFWFHWNS